MSDGIYLGHAVPIRGHECFGRIPQSRLDVHVNIEDTRRLFLVEQPADVSGLL